MKLKVLGTGSSGNCYALQEETRCGQTLLLDAGLPLHKITFPLRGEWKTVSGCLITHEHGDHYQSAYKLASWGIPTYATPGTIAAAKEGRLTQINAAPMLQSIEVGNFTALPFPTEHDASEPCGWLIRCNTTGETVLYATDTYYLRYTFPGVNYWIVECNYTEGLLEQQTLEGKLTQQLRNRLIKSHMSLRRLCDVFKANDLSATRAIILVHLSDDRSDEKVMEDTIKDVTGIDEVHAAVAGSTYSLNLTPF